MLLTLSSLVPSYSPNELEIGAESPMQLLRAGGPGVEGLQVVAVTNGGTALTVCSKNF